jgi:hypothetical protein
VTYRNGSRCPNEYAAEPAGLPGPGAIVTDSHSRLLVVLQYAALTFQSVPSSISEHQIGFESDGITAGEIHEFRPAFGPLIARTQRYDQAGIVAIRPERVDRRQLDPLWAKLRGSIEERGEVVCRVRLLTPDRKNQNTEEPDQPAVR